MVQIVDKRKCSGCGACKNVCPKDAIELVRDSEGFLYPQIDSDKCVNCGLCEQVCPSYRKIVKATSETDYPRFISAQIINKNDLDVVSSGGAAWALTQYVIAQGGVVYGAVQDEIEKVYHFRAETIEEAKRTRRSKYFQSDTGFVFRQILSDLKQNRLVLFIGVGCQVAGLKGFLNKDFPNLITADVICHGVPSLEVWKRYREEIEKEHNAKMTSLIFRDKSNGWNHNQYKMAFENGDVVFQESVNNPFHRGYLIGLFSRPACGSCVFNLIPRESDFTFADYWKYDGEMFRLTMSRGVSLVAINNEKADQICCELAEYLAIEETTMAKALASARHMNNSPVENPNRTEFFRTMTEESFEIAWKKYIKESPTSRIKKKVYDFLRRIKHNVGLFD